MPDCLSSRLRAAVGCTEATNVAFPDPSGVASESAAVVAAGGAYLDPRRWFCTVTTCAVMVDNLLVWRDDNHITVPFATYLAPAVGAYLDAFTHGTV
jgi:SGNH domain (fused to AT3 domains)